jgi:hypothetical protein
MGSISRRRFLTVAGGVATAIPLGSAADATGERRRSQEQTTTPASHTDRIVDMHIHFDEKNSNFIRDLVPLAQRINLTACVLTPYPHRVQVAEAAKQYPKQIVPFGFVDLDASDVLSQVKDFHAPGHDRRSNEGTDMNQSNNNSRRDFLPESAALGCRRSTRRFT